MACMAVRSRACERATCCARPRITLRTRMPALSRVLSAFGWAVTARRLPERCVQLEVVNHVKVKSWSDNYGHASGMRFCGSLRSCCGPRRAIRAKSWRAMGAMSSAWCLRVACFPVDAQSPSAVLEKADEAMYYSKKTGRDGVSFFGLDGTLIRAEAGAAGRTIERRRE